MNASCGTSTLPMAFMRFLPCLLLLEQLALAADVAAVTLRKHVLALGLHRLAREHAPADGGLDGNLEHLARDDLLELFGEHAAAIVGLVAMYDERLSASMGLPESRMSSLTRFDGLYPSKS